MPARPPGSVGIHRDERAGPDNGGRLSLLHHGGAREASARVQPVAVVDRGLHVAGLREVRGPVLLGGRRGGGAGLEPTRDGQVRRWAGDDRAPVQGLERHPHGRPAVEQAIGRLERGRDGRQAGWRQDARRDLHVDLVPLSEVAHLGAPSDRDLRVGHASAPQDASALGFHLLEEPVDELPVGRGQALGRGPHEIERERRGQQPVGRERARAVGDEHARHP
jgi:hypothetical protein